MSFDHINLFAINEFTDSDFKQINDAFMEILNICEKENIHKEDDLQEKYPQIPVAELFNMLDLRASNTNVMKITMKDLSPLLALYDRIIHVMNEEEDYFSYIRQKSQLLFKMRKPDLGEQCMLEYIDMHPDESEAYLELMFSFDGIAHDRESAIYYGDLALSRETLDDPIAVSEFIEDLEA